ncbi:MAG TPA: hypothetical protein VGB73_13690 [Pyrinomonadaceae bacterium]
MRERLVAEIVGPAGAGKSTLARTLRRRDRRISSGFGVWDLPVLLLVLHVFLSLPFVLKLYGARRRLTWGEVQLLVRTRALNQLLGWKLSRDYSAALVLDEGVIFALAKLRAFDSEGINGRGFERWTRELLGEWARRVNTVIWLDAPDQTLAERIRARGKPHRVKSASTDDVGEFMARYRASYEQILSELTSRYGLKVIRFSTDEESTEAVAEKVLAASGAGETISA